MTSRSRQLARSSAAALLLALAIPASAQEFSLGAQDGDYRLQLGSVLQVDGRAVSDAAVSAADRFLVRKARLVVDARLGRYFGVWIVPDFAGGAMQLPDAYVEARVSSRLRVRTGRTKAPVGYELQMADAEGWFPERALPSSLVPNRDVGIEALGDLARGRLSYAAGVFDGSGDGASTASGATGSELAGRVVVRLPRGIGLHVGGSTGGATAVPAFRTSVGDTYFSYVRGASPSGRQNRFAPAAFVYHGRFGAYAEYARSTGTVGRDTAGTRVSNSAFAVSTAYALTGERVSERNPPPRAPFDPSNRGWGAVQVLARYSALEVDRSVFAAGLAAPAASRTARQATLAVNWYPTRFVKWYAAYEHTSFDRSTAPARAPEHSGTVRAQVAF